MRHIDQGLQPKADCLNYPHRNWQTHTHGTGNKQAPTDKYQFINKKPKVHRGDSQWKFPLWNLSSLTSVWYFFSPRNAPSCTHGCRNLPAENKSLRGSSLTHSLTSSRTGGSANIKREDHDIVEVTHQGMKTTYKKNKRWWRGKELGSVGLWHWRGDHVL